MGGEFGIPATEGENALMGAGVPEELENDPYNILPELFAIIPDITKGDYAKIFNIPGLRELIIKLTGFDIRNIPGSMINMMPMLFGIGFRRFVLPVVKGERMMSKMKMPPIPPLPPLPPLPMPGQSDWKWPEDLNWDDGKKKTKKKVKELISSLDEYWEKAIDLQKSSIDGSKDQFDKFFDYITDALDSFAESLPEEIPGMPSWAKPPKSIRKDLKEFEKLANKYFKEQGDSWADFFIEGQEKTREKISEVADSIEEEAEEAEAEAKEEPKETKTTKAAGATKTTRTTKAAKAAEAPKDNK